MFEVGSKLPAEIMKPLESLTAADFTEADVFDTSSQDVRGAIDELHTEIGLLTARAVIVPQETVADSVEAASPTTAEFNALIAAITATGLFTAGE